MLTAVINFVCTAIGIICSIIVIVMLLLIVVYFVVKVAVSAYYRARLLHERDIQKESLKSGKN